jgi:hypothetical protein
VRQFCFLSQLAACSVELYVGVRLVAPLVGSSETMRAVYMQHSKQFCVCAKRHEVLQDTMGIAKHLWPMHDTSALTEAGTQAPQREMRKSLLQYSALGFLDV